MKKSGKKDQENNQNTEIRTIPIPIDLGKVKENFTVHINTPSKQTKEKIINKAIQFHLKGNIAEATKYYQYCINKDIYDSRVLSNYGVICRQQGKTALAKKLYLQSISLYPNSSESYSNLGFLLKEDNDPQGALKYIQKAIELNPDNVNAHLNLGWILRDLGKLEDAELSLKKAIKLKPDLADAHSNLGIILKDLGKLEDAEFSLRKAIELKPEYSDSYYDIFIHYEKLNDLKKLKEVLKEFSQIKIIKNELLLFQSRLRFREKKYNEAKKIIDLIPSEWVHKSPENRRLTFWSYKGFIEEKVNNYNLAFSCFEKSQKNSIYQKLKPELYLDYISSYKKSVTNRSINIRDINNNSEESNIGFLIGFPRSGTTLLDTILRSHPDIDVIEEQPIIATIETLIQEDLNIKLENIFSISDTNIILLRKKYSELLNKYKNKQAKITIDKLPLHTASIPIIHLLFPNAKIIFTHRHPYDTVLSCFQQFFKPNEAMANFISLKFSARMYDHVMDAWHIYKSTLALDFITSKYENLIGDFDSHTLKIFKFLEIEWNYNIKNYKETALARGKINTPSSHQVVQPLYKSSINKWKNYDKYFYDCHKYLDKWISYFNY